jgi:hypothetical protein
MRQLRVSIVDARLHLGGRTPSTGRGNPDGLPSPVRTLIDVIYMTGMIDSLCHPI